MIQSDSRGAATLEMVLALPVLLLLLLGGLMLGNYVYTRLALNWHVFQRAEELATRSAVLSVVDSGWTAVAGEKGAGLAGDSFRGYSFAVPIPDQPFVVAAACQPVPFALPHFSQATSPASATPAAASGFFPQLQSLIANVQELLNGASAPLDQAEDVVDDLLFARQVAAELADQRARYLGVRQLGSWAMEPLMDEVCRTDGHLSVTARAVIWGEKTKALPANPYGLKK